MTTINTIEGLKTLALGGNVKALDELSKGALGGNIEARKIINQIERENIIFKNEEIISRNKKRVNILDIPIINLLNTKRVQFLVKIDEAQSPVGSNQEDFPNLNVFKALRLLKDDRKLKEKLD